MGSRICIPGIGHATQRLLTSLFAKTRVLFVTYGRIHRANPSNRAPGIQYYTDILCGCPYAKGREVSLLRVLDIEKERRSLVEEATGRRVRVRGCRAAVKVEAEGAGRDGRGGERCCEKDMHDS